MLSTHMMLEKTPEVNQLVGAKRPKPAQPHYINVLSKINIKMVNH